MLAPHCQKQAARPWLRRFGAGMAVLGLCVSTLAQAFNIGHARVESAVNEPLQFSVLITAIDPAEIEQLNVQVAPVTAWQALGLQPLSAVLDAQVQLLPAHTPDAVVARFFSPQPVDAQVIDVLVDVQLAGEQQQHQVSMLQQPKPTVQLPTQRGQQFTDAALVPAPATVHEPSAAPDTLSVQRGDTLHAIAQRINSPHGSEFQVLAALYALNPHAFSQKNMNLLLAGERLKLPSAQQIQALSDRRARQLYVEHVQRFNHYKEALARGATDSDASAVFAAPSVVDAPVKQQPVPAKSEASVNDQAVSVKPESVAEQADRLRLADATSAQDEAQAQEQASQSGLLSADDQRAQERALAHAEKEITELQAQIDQLDEAQAELHKAQSAQTAPTAASDEHTQALQEQERALEQALAKAEQEVAALQAEIAQLDKDLKLADEAAQVDAATQIEESAQADEARQTDEPKQTDEARQADESRQADEARQADESRQADGPRQADESRQADEARGDAGADTQAVIASDALAARKEAAQAKLKQAQEKLQSAQAELQKSQDQRAAAAAKTDETAQLSADTESVKATDSVAGTKSAGTTPITADSALPSKSSQPPKSSASTNDMEASWIQTHFIKLMLALLLFIVIFTVWILRRANKTTVELESPDRMTAEMIQAKLDDINLDLDVPPSDEGPVGHGDGSDRS